jgi:NADH-quinone oxidoreductase subunit J
MTIFYVVLATALMICAVQAIRASRLLPASLWLAALSAFVSILLYLLGAREVAVIELSVGAGLVTVLLAFVIGLAGDETLDATALVPAPLALVLVATCLMLLSTFVLPVTESIPQVEQSFSVVLWQVRGLDLLAQLVLILAGALGVRTLLHEAEVRFAMPDYRLRLIRKSETGPAPLEGNNAAADLPTTGEGPQ